MNKFEIFGVLSTLLGIAYGFGKQSASINQNKRDINAVAERNREILATLNEIKATVARLDQRVIYCEKE